MKIGKIRYNLDKKFYSLNQSKKPKNFIFISIRKKGLN